jgi:hypothetical protein
LGRKNTDPLMIMINIALALFDQRKSTEANAMVWELLGGDLSNALLAASSKGHR